ncbi:ABC transporter permease [Bacteroidota bacterium]
MTSFIQTNNNIIRIGDSDLTVSEAVIADTAFQDFFGIELIVGRKEDLGLPNTVFLTSELAEKLFPGENAYGKEFFLDQIEGNTNDSLGLFTVKGIVRPLPDNTHFGFQMIYSQKGNFSGLVNHLKNNKVFGANVYVRIDDRNKVPTLEADLDSVLVPFLSRSYGPPVEAFNSRLQAVREIHFTTDLNREPRPVIRKSALYLLFSVGGLILVLMCVNFLSMAIVQSLRQRKETGIMRTLGAENYEIYKLSLSKVFLLVGTAIILSLLMVLLSGKWLEHFFESGWNPWNLIWKILLFSFVVGLSLSFIVASAMHFSNAFRSPTDLIKGEMTSGKNLFRILGTLIVVQFGIVVFLIGFSLMIDKQLKYLNNKDLGYNSKNVLVARIPGQQPRGSLLLEEIRKQSSVISASTVHHHPGDVFQHMGFAAGQKEFPFEFRMVDRDAINTLDIKLLKRFGPENGEMEGWLINETFYNHLLQDFSEEDISGSNFNLPEEETGGSSRSRFIIAGVMSDFHYSSLHDRIGNFAFAIRNPESSYNRWLIVRFHDGQYRECLDAVNGMMETHFPGRSNENFTLSENLENKYASSRKLSQIILVFTMLSIIIAGFGLYGLSAFMAQQRTKEIGIRKVFGASTNQVLILLNQKFLTLVAISFCIACPVTIWAIKKWIINFAYNTSPSVWIFILTGIIITSIAIISVTWQTASASRRNPVDAIRYE